MTQTVLSNRPALQGLLKSLDFHPYEKALDALDDDEHTTICNKTRNNLASIHTTCLVLTQHLDGFKEELDNDAITMSPSMKKQHKDIRELREATEFLISKINQVLDSGMKLSAKGEEHKRNDAIDLNYDILDHVLTIAMDCDHKGGFNNTGNILVEMPEKTFNELKIPHFALKQMNVYGSVVDRDEQFFD